MDDFKFNPYKILDLPKNASEAEIKRRYRKLVKQHHPDKHKSAEGAEGIEERQVMRNKNNKIFKAVEKAYHLLITSDPTKKYKVELSFDELKEGFTEERDKGMDDEKPTENPVKTVDKEDLKVDGDKYDPELINRLQKSRDDELFNIKPVLNKVKFEQSIFNQLFDHNKKRGREMIKYTRPNKCFSKSSTINDNSYANINCYDDHVENPDPVLVDVNRFTQDEKVITVDKIDCNTFEKEINKYKNNLDKSLTLSSDVYEVHENKFFDLW